MSRFYVGPMVAIAVTLSAAAPAVAVTAALCVKATLKGPIKLRAGTPCKPSELQIGSFDGTTIQFSGVNLQVVSGSGATNGAVNGKGNLIVGYNEATSGQTRIGSHNLIVGQEHEYTSYGGFVAGRSNQVTNANASVSDGEVNTASGDAASVSGGAFNTASGYVSAVSGGQNNMANGTVDSISGGQDNTADGGISGGACSVSGGQANHATGSSSSVSGGVGITEAANHGWSAGSTGPAAGPFKWFSH